MDGPGCARAEYGATINPVRVIHADAVVPLIRSACRRAMPSPFLREGLHCCTNRSSRELVIMQSSGLEVRMLVHNSSPVAGHTVRRPTLFLWHSPTTRYVAVGIELRQGLALESLGTQSLKLVEGPLHFGGEKLHLGGDPAALVLLVQHPAGISNTKVRPVNGG